MELALEAEGVVELQGLKRVRNLLTSCPDHIFLCMPAYYVEWQMKQKLAPLLLFAEEDREGAAEERKDIVSPAVPSEATEKKARPHRTSDGLPVQTFGGLLDDLGTLVKNMMQAGKDEGRASPC